MEADDLVRQAAMVVWFASSGLDTILAGQGATEARAHDARTGLHIALENLMEASGLELEAVVNVVRSLYTTDRPERLH